MNVLIVDPSRTFHRLVGEIFSLIGVHAIASSSLNEAKEILNTQKIAYVCASMHLPDGTGTGLCRYLRSSSVHAFTPFFLLSSESPASLRDEAFLAGVTDIFEKNDIHSLATYLHRLNRQFEYTTGRVLIIEDSPSQAAFYQAALTSCGLLSDVCNEGMPALKLIASGIYDLVLLDLVLPGELSGVMTASHIRRIQGEAGDIPILAATAFDESARRVELFYVGINDYLPKPVAAEELVARARSLILSSRSLREARTNFQKIEQEIHLRSSRDPTTGLFNRWHFESQLNEILNTGAGNTVLAVIEVATSRLINDSCGHQAGNQFLQEIAHELSNKLPDGLWARIGSARLGIIVRHCTGETLQDRLNTALTELRKQKFSWHNLAFERSVHAGILFPLSLARSADDALNMADSACRGVKPEEKNLVAIFDRGNAELSNTHRQRDAILPLLDAIRHGQFELHFQTINSKRGNEKPGYEILIRMRSHTGELLPPARFLPTAELYGLISQIDRWVTTHAFDWLAACGNAPPCAYLAINLSGLTITDRTFTAFVADELARTGIDPKIILFEITETAAIADIDAANRMISALRAAGCRFALDDFGSGVSSFGQLRNLPVDVLKIDGQFVRNMLGNSLDEAIIRSIMDVARAAGMETVAEFVESDALAKRLAEIGVDYLQGYAFGLVSPLPLTLKPAIED